MKTLESFLLTYVLNSLWQVPLVFAAAWLAARLSRRAGPAFQHRLWVSALFAQVLLPACSFQPAEAIRALQHWLSLLLQSHAHQTSQVTIMMGKAHAENAFQLPPALLTAVAVVYLGTILFFTVKLASRVHRTLSLRTRTQPLTLPCDASHSYHCYARLFAVTNATLATSAEIVGPMTLGIRHPILLLPLGFHAGLSTEDLDAALAHEFAHLRRRDFAKNLFYEILSLPAAFHPMLRLTHTRIAESRELLCDSIAADVVAGPQRYARSLLRLASRFSEHIPTPATHAIGIFDANHFMNFERRIMHLTDIPTELKGARRMATAAVCLGLLGGACTSALAFRMQITAPPLQPAPVTGVYGGVNSGVDAEVHAPVSANTQTVIQAAQEGPARVASGVIAGNRVTFVQPVYPPDAKTAKLSGIVVLRAIISKDGAIKQLAVVSGPAEFKDSALDAVKQWTYKPYLLNGDPVEVETTITVNYSLQK